jgi:Tol biopolymer transport system component
MKRISSAVLAFVASVGVASAQTARRPLSLDDLGKLKEVRDPQCAPDGKSVAFVVSQIDVKEDKAGASHIWTIGLDGNGERQITSSPDSESAPRFSPDGKYLSFTSSRPGKAKGNQVWLLDRSGGEAFQLTEVKGRLQGYEWSPDSKRLALVIGDPDPDAETPAAGAAAGATADGGGRGKAPKPIVIDRYKFKQDVQGYLLSGRHSYVYLFDIASKRLDRLTNGKADESSPSWSPDGTHIAFMSNRQPDPDREPSSQLFVAEAKAGSSEKALTTLASHGGRGRAEWSPDSKWIAFLEGDDKKDGAYGMEHLALVAADGATVPERVKATENLDRGVTSPHFSADGKSILVLVTDDQSVYPVNVTLAGNRVDKPMKTPIVVSNPTMAGGCAAVLSGDDDKPTEVYRVSGSGVPERRFRFCCGFTAGQTVRISIRSASSASGSPRTATRCSPSTIAAVRDAVRSSPSRSRLTGVTTKSTICRRWSIRS